MRLVSRKFRLAAEKTLAKLQLARIKNCWDKADSLKLIAAHFHSVRKVVIACYGGETAFSAAIKVFQSCPQLESIGIIPGGAINCFNGMLHRIRELAVSIESATELDSIAVKCDNLEILEIEWAPFAPSRRSLLQVFSSCTRIRSLSLWGFSVEPSQFLVAKRIEELFFYSTNLDDDYLESLSLQLCDKPLRRLKISGQTCTIRGILSVALYLPELEELNISYTKVDGDDVADLLSAKNTRGELQVLRHLKHLSIGWDQVDVVKKRLSSLRKNMVVDCSPWCKQKCCVAD